MHISGWHIDGFGAFRDEHAADLPPGLVVFHGPNEAGKSTLLAFLRAVLFGLEANGRERRYPPLRGGRHGGRIFLETAEGRITIERELHRRVPPRVWLADGTAATEDELRRILGGADARLFRTVFAISLTELQTFEVLDEEGVRDRIFSAGVVGAGRSARHLSEQLARRQEELLRPRAGGRINELEQTLLRLEGELAEARRAAAEYSARVAEDARCQDAIHELDAASFAAAARRRRYETLLALWPTHVELTDARRELDGLPAIDTFPPEALVRLTEVSTRLEAARHDVVARRAALETAQARAAELRAELDDAAAAVAAEAEALHEAASLYRDQLQQRPALVTEHQAAWRVVEEAIAALGPGWDEARVASFNRSIPRREEVREWQAALEAARQDAATAAQEEAFARRAAQQMEAEWQRTLERAPAPVSFDADSLAAEEAAIRRLRASVAELRALEQDCDLLRTQVAEREAAVRQLEATGTFRVPAWLAVVVGIVGVVLLGLGAWRANTVGTLGAAAQVAAGLVLGVVALELGRRAGRDREAAQARDVELRERRAALARERERLRAREREASELGQQVQADAALFGRDTRPSLHEVEELDRAVAARREALREWEAARRALAELEAEAARVEADVGKVTRHRIEAERVQREVEARWAAWKEEAGLPATLSPEAALDVFDTVRRAREALRARDEAALRLLRLDQEISGWTRRAREALAAAGNAASGVAPRAGTDERGTDEATTAAAAARAEAPANEPTPAPAADAADLPARIAALRDRCRADAAARARLAALEDEIRAAAEALAAAEARLERVEQERSALLAAGGARDEEEFRERHEIWRRRQELSALGRRLAAELNARLGGGPEADALRAELETGQKAEWEAAAAAATTELEGIAARREEAVRRHQDAERARQALEASADVPRLEAERQAVLTELAQAARAWSTAAVARALVQETLRDYERSRQPKVLEVASRIFEGVTAGRYRRVHQDQEGRELIVVDRHDGRRRTVDLSRGTAEQLYLSLRLALAAEFAERSVPLPIVLDDVLVNFDPGRARAMAAALARTAEDQQVLLFTCQPSTVEILLEVCPEAFVHELERVEGPTASSLEATPGGAPRDAAADGAGRLILDCLRAAGAPLAKSEILARTGVEPSVWPRVIAELTSAGIVLRSGERRGATYRLSPALVEAES